MLRDDDGRRIDRCAYPGGRDASPAAGNSRKTAPYELDSVLSAEDKAILQSLMNAGQADHVEFMG